jgi:hypothetical protein
VGLELRGLVSNLHSIPSHQRCGLRNNLPVGKRVIILGNGLTGTNSVTFNGTPAAFNVESDNYIMATVPTGATAGTISVATPTGHSTATRRSG